MVLQFSKFSLICLAFFTCFIWMNTYKKTHYISYKNYKKTQDKSGQLGLAGWWAKTNKKKLKYLLVWPSINFKPFSQMMLGQDEFLALKCPVTNCFVTSNQTVLKDIRKFDAIAFMGEKLDLTNIPIIRALYQVYIFFTMESNPNYPCDDLFFDGFFNWTATYRLDSDIPLPNILIRDKKGKIVGPKINMQWMPEEPVEDELIPDIAKHKSKAAAIYYSSCRSVSAREELIQELNEELNRFHLAVHVYGSCGRYKCKKKNGISCRERLTRDYYFYLSYENSLDFDYVTEKVLAALQNYVVPVVYGGANYSRFLPPGSYLDASEMTDKKLAKTMVQLMASPKRYHQYFWWRKYYTYHNPIMKENICNICAALNDEKMLKKPKFYKNFRKWWNINTE